MAKATINKKWFAAAAVLALSGTLAFAAPHDGLGGKHGHGRHGGGELGERFAQKLNLTDAQKQQMKDIQQRFRDDNKTFFDSMRDTRSQMREAREAGDTARLESLRATAKSQHEQMKQLRQAQMQRIETILTTEQRAQWQALKAEREARRGERGQGRNRGDRQ